jgi:hypothetical protein
MRLRGAFAVGLLLTALGCGGAEYEPVTVKVQAPDRTGKVVPIAGAELTLLPFDIDSLYKALEAKNQAGPEPSAEALEALYQAFNSADTALPRADSMIGARQAALEQIKDRASDEYRTAFKEFEQAQKTRDSIAAARDSAEARYSPAREAYNRARLTWETSAWDQFNDVQEKLYKQAKAPHDSAGKEIAWRHKTGEDGTFKIWVGPGRWWIAGRTAVPGSVHDVYRWNEPFTVDGGPVTVELTGDKAKKIKTY